MAAVSATRVHLRSTLMTTMTMIIDMLPLMFAHDVGTNGNISVGVGTVEGLLVGPSSLLFIALPLFIFFQSKQERFLPIRSKMKG